MLKDTFGTFSSIDFTCHLLTYWQTKQFCFLVIVKKIEIYVCLFSPYQILNEILQSMRMMQLKKMFDIISIPFNNNLRKRS